MFLSWFLYYILQFYNLIMLSKNTVFSLNLSATVWYVKLRQCCVKGIDTCEIQQNA